MNFTLTPTYKTTAEMLKSKTYESPESKSNFVENGASLKIGDCKSRWRGGGGGNGFPIILYFAIFCLANLKYQNTLLTIGLSMKDYIMLFEVLFQTFLGLVTKCGSPPDTMRFCKLLERKTPKK